MPRLPDLEPITDPISGVMTSAIPKGSIQKLPKIASTIQPPTIEPEAQSILNEMDNLAQPVIVPQPTVSPQIEPEAQAVLNEMDKLTGTIPQVAPVIPPPEQSFLQKSAEAWKVGWAQYAANKLRGLTVLPGVGDEWLMQKAKDVESLVDSETMQRVNELTGGQLQMTDFVSVVKQLPKIGWYGMIQNSPQMFDALVANKFGQSLGGVIGGVGGPAGRVAGALIGGHAAGVASAGLTEAGNFKGQAMESLLSAGVDEQTANTLADKYARIYGPAAGVVEYASDIFQIMKISKGLRKSAIDTLRKMPIWKLMLDPLTTGLSEGGEELSQGWLSNKASQMMWDEAEKVTGKKLARPEPQALLQQGIAGFAIGTTMGAMGLPVNISSKIQQNKQAEQQKKLDAEQYKSDLRANLTQTLGVSPDLVDQSGVIDQMEKAKDETEREQILNAFADKYLKTTLPPPPALDIEQTEAARAAAAARGEVYFDTGKPVVKPPKAVEPAKEPVLPEKAVEKRAETPLKAVKTAKGIPEYPPPTEEAIKTIERPIEPTLPPPTPTTTEKVETLAPVKAGEPGTQKIEEARVGAPISEEKPTAITPIAEVGKKLVETEGKPNIKQVGHETQVYGTRGESFQAKYVVVPREELVASHDPTTFAKNPLYPLENPRDYSSEGEQTKVLTIKKEFSPDQHVTDSTSAAVGPVMAAHITDDQGNRRLVVLGGNNREMVMQSMNAQQRKALADFTNERAERFGVKKLPDAEHELIRYMGEFDLRQKGMREKLQGIVDSLNPSPGKAQNLMEMAAIDADTRIKPEHLTGLTADITPEEAQTKVEQFIGEEVLDRNTRAFISEHPAQAQEYLRRVMVNVAFRNPVLADFAATTDRKKLAGRGLVETAVPTVVELRHKGQNEMADAIGRTMGEVTGYMDKGDSLQIALGKAAEQTGFDPRFAIVQDIASAMRDRIVLNKKGAINTDETIDNFMSFWDRVGEAVKQWEETPDMFGKRINAEDVIRNVMTEIKTEQQAIRGLENKEISMSRTRRYAPIPAQELRGLEMPFNLRGEQLPATKPITPATAEEPTQRELFAIQKVTSVIDPEKSANLAQALYGSPERALRIMRNQLDIINSDPKQRLLYPKEARERLKEVFALLGQRIQDQQRKSLVPAREGMPTVNAKTAQSVVDQFTSGWKNKPKGGIMVIQSEEDADALNLSDESMEAIGDFKPEGFYHLPTDTIVIIADNLERTRDVIRVALHEAVAHSGLRKMLGAKFESELELIGKKIPEVELTDIAIRYGLDLSNTDDRLEAYEEYLGKYAETRNPGLWQRFLAAIRRALQAMGLNEHIIDIFDKRGDVDRLIDAGREFIERGTRVEPIVKEGLRYALKEGTRVPEGTPRIDIDKSRFLKRAVLSEDMLPEVKAKLDKWIDYEIQHHADTKAAVKNVLTEYGPNEAEAMFFRDDKKIIPAARIPLGAALLHMHLEAAKQATNTETKDGHMNAAIDIGRRMTDMGLESGQVSESFSMYHSGEMLEMPGGAALMFNRLIRDSVQKEVEKLPVSISEVKQVAQTAVKEDVIEAMAQKRAYEILDTILERLGKTARNNLPARLRNKDNQEKYKAFFAQHRQQMSAFTKFALPAALLEEKIGNATLIGAEFITESKVLNYGDWSAKMKSRLGDGITPYLRRVWNESSMLADRIPSGKVSPAAEPGVKVGPKAKQKGKKAQPTFTMTAEIRALIDEWLAQPITPTTIQEVTQPTTEKPSELKEPTERTLPVQKRLIQSLAELGMTEAEGFKFITNVQMEAAKRAKAKKESRLKQLLKGVPISPTSHSAIERILEISAIRRLDNTEIMDIFAEKIGLPKMTPELATKLEDLAEKIRKAPEGYPKIKAGREMMAFIRKQMPLDKVNVGWSLWYANILSGYQTQERNMISTFDNVMANLATSMIVDPKNAPFALRGFVNGIKRGWREAKYELKTGDVPIHITPELKYEVPPILESNPFTGFARVFNNWKYVMRAMIAEDMIMFKPVQEARAMMLAADVAREEGLSGRQLWGRVADIMGTTETQRKTIEKQALADGFSGIELQHRIDELMERQRPTGLQLESLDYAKRATFNYQPEGLAGYAGELIRRSYTRAPFLRFIVPFTRIVANVTNNSLDYTPWGFIRAKFGVRQIGGEMRTIVGHERAQLQAKAFLGTLSMITTYLLDRLNDDDDEEKKFFAIYGSGPGESKKANQLRALGWKPWSVKVGKYYIDYRLTPMAIPFGIIGSIRDAERWRKMDEKSLWARAAFSTLRSADTLLEMSFLSGLGNFLETINPQSSEQSARNARAFITRNTVGAVVPNFFKQIDRTFDPTLRDNSSFYESIMREVPVVSRGVKPRLNVLGEIIPQTTGPISLMISPAKSDPLWRLIVKNEAWISVPDKVQHIGKRLMTEDEYYKFIKYRGETLRERIEKNMTALEGLNKEQFNKRINRYTEDSATRAKNRIRRESKESAK